MLNNSFNDEGIESFSKFEDGSVTVRLNKMGNQIVTLTADEAVAVLDLDHKQYTEAADLFQFVLAVWAGKVIQLVMNLLARQRV